MGTSRHVLNIGIRIEADGRSYGPAVLDIKAGTNSGLRVEITHTVLGFLHSTFHGSACEDCVKRTDGCCVSDALRISFIVSGVDIFLRKAGIVATTQATREGYSRQHHHECCCVGLAHATARSRQYLTVT
uniref:Uncharacterized protein n=1 Tax=uncultured marine group III euryarchaeote KM3-28-E8 TaxID=526676 RepID=B3V6K8_9ARCH|nr:hypothetical protein [uncultured marine group III euryarchaeote KM3-28-E8]